MSSRKDIYPTVRGIQNSSVFQIRHVSKLYETTYTKNYLKKSSNTYNKLMVNLMDILVYSLVMKQSMQEIVPGILNHCTSKTLGNQNIPLKSRRTITYRI